MKRLLIAAILMLGLIGGGYVLYHTVLLPRIFAEAVISESLPDYIPKRLLTRMEAIRKPINKGTEAMIVRMHESRIPLDEVLAVVDNITEDQAYAFVDEFNRLNPTTTDEVFDVAKKHFPTPFDVEVFREPFKKHFQMKQIRNAIAYANMNRKSNDVELITAKAIFKKIIIEKDEDVKLKIQDSKFKNPD